MSALRIDPRAVALRAWAEGDVAQVAAVKLLIGAAGARLLGGPRVRRHASGGFWFDADLASLEGGYLSGGERRVLSIASSLASSAHRVDLRNAVTGLEPDLLRKVLEALRHAGGVTAGLTGRS